MDIIKLRDNRFGNNAPLFEHKGLTFVWENIATVGEQVQRLLEKFGSKNLSELASKAGGNLILLGGTHADTLDRREQQFFTFKEKDDSNHSFRLETGNLMGVLRFRDKESGASVQVEVLSRFDNGDKNFFLNYLLSKVFDCALGMESVSAQRSSLLEILLDIVFVRRLDEAAKAGLLRHYREFRNNNWSFKGSIDLPRHIRENIPLMHGIAYRKREIDLDVPVNRMILMAALKVNRRHPIFFSGNRDAADALRQLRMGVTEERDTRTVLSYRDCREPVSHPFFREVWEPLRRIARMIIEDEHWTLFSENTTEDEVSGIVFDGSWLWEEYIATVLKPAGFWHCVRGGAAGRVGLRVFVDGPVRFYPDFLKSDGTSVLDTKYKRSNPNGGRDDVHQMLCYLLLTGAKFGGFVFPPIDHKCEDNDACTAEENGGSPNTNNMGGWSSIRKIDSPYSTEESPIRWSCFSWELCCQEAKDQWKKFEEYMKGQEDKLRNLPISRASKI